MCVLKNLYLGKFSLCRIPTNLAVDIGEAQAKFIKYSLKILVAQKSKCIAVLEPIPRN